MQLPARRVVLVLAILLCSAGVANAGGATLSQDPATFLAEARALMGRLRAESRRDAARMKKAYADGARASAFRNFMAVISARTAGTLAPLPINPLQFNIRPRLTGPRAIGELDVAHRDAYVAARPGTLGCLLHVAATLRRTPVDVTSLVRHLEYQRALSAANVNARTDFPAHALGLAFDLSIVNVPLSVAQELRDVLRHMRSNGDLFFVAETRQLVFHVVPTPERLPFYAALYESQVNLLPPPVLRHMTPKGRSPMHVANTPQAESDPPSGFLLSCVSVLCITAYRCTGARRSRRHWTWQWPLGRRRSTPTARQSVVAREVRQDR